MASFITKVPVDVPGVKALLPADSDFEKVVWDEQNKVVEFHWSNRYLLSPYTSNDYPITMLHEKVLPDKITVRARVAAVTEPKGSGATTEPKPVDTKPTRGVRKLR